LGIIGPSTTRAQAQERVDEYAKRAVEAAVEMALKLRKMDELERAEGLREI
jgi:6,7-dimethyl-8-ribityllumazine synthase